MKLLIDLYFTFFKIGLFTFGGGLTMLPLLERTLVGDKGWTTMDDLLDYYSIAQTTPGIIAVNVSTFVGYSQKKIAGAVAATFGMVSPSLIIIIFIASFISNFQDIEVVQKAMKGINAAVAALLTYSVIGLCKKNITSVFSFLLFVFAFVSLFCFSLHTLAVTLVAAACGIVGHAVSVARKGGK